MVGAAAAGFGVHQGGELGRRARSCPGSWWSRGRAPGGPARRGGLGEQAGEFDLAGAGPPVGALAGPVGDGGGHHRHPGAVDGDVELVRRLCSPRSAGAGSTPTRRRAIAADSAASALGGGGAVGLGGAFDPLGGQPDSGQFGEQVGGGGERLGGRGAGGHRAQARRQRRAGDTEFVVAGRDPALAFGAVIVGAAHGDPAQHGVDVLVAVADELGEMPGAAVDPRPAVPGVGGQQLLQQLGAQLGHRGADRQLHRPPRPRREPSESAASAASRSTSAANAAAIWSRSPLFRPPSRPGAPSPPGSVGAPHRSPR